MKRKIEVPRVLVPMLGMIALALVVNGLPAQEREPRVEEPAPPARVAPPAVMSWRTMVGGSYLGVYIREVGDEDVARLGLGEERGALVTDVAEEGPAAAAGLEADDVIVSWNGGRVESAAQLRRLVTETPAGRSVEVGYVREGRQRTASVELDERSPEIGRAFSRGAMNPEARARLRESLDGARGRLRALRDHEGFAHVFMWGGRLGIAIQSLGDQLAGYFGVSDGGVLVASVREDSPAAEAGLRAGDVITRVGGERVEEPGDLMREISRAEPGELELGIVRDRQEQTIRATLPDSPEGIDEASSYFFYGPRSGAFDLYTDGPWAAWQHAFDGVGLLDDFELPDMTIFQLEPPDLESIEIELPELPELEPYVPAPTTPANPSIRT